MYVFPMILIALAQSSIPATPDLHVLSVDGRSLTAADRNSITINNGVSTITLHMVRATPDVIEVANNFQWVQRYIWSFEVDCNKNTVRFAESLQVNFSDEVIFAESLPTNWITTEPGSPYDLTKELVCRNITTDKGRYDNIYQLMSFYYKLLKAMASSAE